MNIYEHGISSQIDEWDGSLKLIATSNLPTFSGFSTAIVDPNGKSLYEKAINLARVNGAHYSADYFEESDLRYCALASLYHLNRLVDLYTAVTALFEKLHSFGTTLRGNTSEPRIYYELDAFFGAARRIYESMRKVLWKHFAAGTNGRWRSIVTALSEADRFPTLFAAQLTSSWKTFGQKLSAYRDCLMHNDPLNDGQNTVWLEWYGTRWGASVKLPSNPERKSRRSFDFANGLEALSYCHEVACHLVDICGELLALDEVRHHLEFPKYGA